MFRKLLSWLGLEVNKTVGLRPHRTVTLDATYDEAFDRVTDGISNVLGGTVRESDRATGYVEASFGLTFSERIVCTVERCGVQTNVTIEARRQVQNTGAQSSAYVDALALYLTK